MKRHGLKCIILPTHFVLFSILFVFLFQLSFFSMNIAKKKIKAGGDSFLDDVVISVTEGRVLLGGDYRYL